MIATITVTCNILDQEDDSKFVPAADAKEFARDAVEEALQHAMNRGFNRLPEGITCVINNVE